MSVNRSTAAEGDNFVAELCDLMKRFLIQQGVPAAEAVRLAERFQAPVFETFGGATLYVRMGRKESSEQLRGLILAEFNGTNHRQLAAKHRVSERHVYRVLKEMSRKRA